jgi:SHAQKYF class myb-like DNA-binding protein
MESSDDTALNTGMWTPDEHQRFIEAIKMFGKDWVAIEQHVQTRSAKQVKSHSQKFL